MFVKKRSINTRSFKYSTSHNCLIKVQKVSKTGLRAKGVKETIMNGELWFMYTIFARYKAMDG